MCTTEACKRWILEIHKTFSVDISYGLSQQDAIINLLQVEGKSLKQPQSPFFSSSVDKLQVHYWNTRLGCAVRNCACFDAESCYKELYIRYWYHKLHFWGSLCLILLWRLKLHHLSQVLALLWHMEIDVTSWIHWLIAVVFSLFSFLWTSNWYSSNQSINVPVNKIVSHGPYTF